MAKRTPAIQSAVAAVILTAAMAGCATAPSGGPPQVVRGGNSQVEAYALPLPPPPPTSSWQPQQVVLSFLHASATYALDQAAVRQYLIPQIRKTWSPGAVTVVRSLSAPSTTVTYRGAVQGPEPAPEVETVKYTGERLATLSQAGQYFPSTGASAYQFVLARVNGIWLIQSAPKQLLLTQADFESVYQPRNLFFWNPSKTLLVPDPVYAPIQVSDSALNSSLATGLVKGLLNVHGSWLYPATWSAFPTGTTLLGQVTISGQQAVVNLGGAAAHVPQSTVESMDDQLRETLSNGTYSVPLADQVLLEINGHPRYPGVYPTLVPEVAQPTGAPQPVFATTGPSTVGELKSHGSLEVLGPAQIGQQAITAIASYYAGNRPELAVAVQSGSGCAVLLGNESQVQPYHGYQLAGSTAPCTSLSWDSSGNLWAAAGSGIWELQQADARPVRVSWPASPLTGRGARVLQLQMAPDAVRAAMLVHTAAGNRLILAAVSYAHGTVSFGQAVNVGIGLPEPVAVTWYDAYHLAVLAGSGVYLVPLTGAVGQRLVSAPVGADSIATDGSTLLVGTTQDEIYSASGGAYTWHHVTQGANPVYPAYPS